MSLSGLEKRKSRSLLRINPKLTTYNFQLITYMDTFSYVLLAVLPSIVVFLTSFYLIKMFVRNEQKKNFMELKAENQKTTVPIRLQAFERVALYLERISPSNMIMRIYKPGMSARLLQSELLKTVRTEYDHNVAQQVYMSSAAWQSVKTAKEETIRMINIASTRISDDANGNDLSKSILEVASQLDKNPSEYALEFIKKEIRAIF